MISDFTCRFSHRSAICISWGRITFPRPSPPSGKTRHDPVRVQARMQAVCRDGGMPKWLADFDAARARVLIMFFQNKWAFRWVRRWRWRCFHGVPGNHGNPVTPLSGHGVSLPRRWGYLRTGDERREGHNAPAVDLSPCVRLSELVVRSSRILGEPRQERGKERKGREKPP